MIQPVDGNYRLQAQYIRAVSVVHSCLSFGKLWVFFLSWLTWPSSSSRTLRSWSGHHLSQTKQSNNVRQILRQFKILQAGSRSNQKRCQNEFKIIQVFLLREQNHAKSHGIRSHKIAWSRMIQQIYDIPIYRYTWYNASIHSPVPASGSRNAGKPATKRTNMLQTNQRKHEQTGTNQWYLIIKSIIKSSFRTDESWEEDHQHQPHGSSRPLPHPWAFPQQSDTLIDSYISYIT